MGRSPGSGRHAGHRDRTGAVEDRGVGDDLPLDVADSGVLHRLGERPDAGEREIPRRREAGYRQRRIPVADQDEASLERALAASFALPALEDPGLQPPLAAEAIEVRGSGEELRVRSEDARVRARVRVEESLRVRVYVVDVGAAGAAYRVDLPLQDVPQMVAGDALFRREGVPSRATGVRVPSFGSDARTPAAAGSASSETAARIPARPRKLAIWPR